MIFEVQNPSDAMTIEADDYVVAGVAMLYLGEGKIGLTDEAGETAFPILAFGGDEALDGWLEHVGIGLLDDLRPYCVENKDKIAVCLESIVYGSISDRKGILATVEGREYHEVLIAMKAWNDAKRSSLNDFSAVAFSLASQIRQMEAEETEKTSKAKEKA
jgi:hypothetical protein